MLLKMFRTILKDHLKLSEEKLDELVDAFMNAIAAVLKSHCRQHKYKNMTTEYMLCIEFSRCIVKIYMRSLS